MKKTILILLVLISNLVYLGANAYTSEDLITLHIDSPDTWTSLYIVPDWKDLILNRILSSDINEEIEIRNGTWAILAHVFRKEEYVWWELVIKDEVQIQSIPWTSVHIMLFWFLVDEDEDIEHYINWTSNTFNKNIFTKDDLDFIYFREFIFFTLLSVFTFFEKVVIGRKSSFKIFW